MKITYIYALMDPETNETRYIGRSKNLKRRLYEHHQTSRLKTFTHHNNWIKSLINKGLKAKMVLLEECNEFNWSDRERYWILNTPNLTNTTEGGEGEFERHIQHIYTDEIKVRIGQAVSNLHKSGKYKSSHILISKSLQGTKSKVSSNKFCGTFLTKNNTWLSQIQFNKKQLYLGIYKKEQDAAIAYDIKALELFGLTAKFNFPDMVGQLVPPKKTSDKKSSKYKGVNFQDNKWIASHFVNGKRKHLGTFQTEESAYKARCDAILKENS